MPREDAITRRNELSYKAAGVDIDAGAALVEAIKPLAKSTARPGSDAGLGGFGGFFDLKAAGYEDPVLVAANDGVGTKVKIAIACDRHDSLGIDLVAMCVNDLVVQGAEPLFFLDYFATGKLELAQGEAIVAGIAEGCRQAGCTLIGGETAEMPGLYAAGDYDLAGFAVGAVERGAALTGRDIAEGDLVLGLASNGLHSNGFSLVRKVVELQGLDYAARRPSPQSRTWEKRSSRRLGSTSALAWPRFAPAGSRGWPISPVAACPKTYPACCRRAWRWNCKASPGRSPASSPGWRRPAAFRAKRCSGPSIAASAWWPLSTRPGRGPDRRLRSGW